MKMLWGGRFSAEPADEMFRLTASIDIDLRLLEADVRVTKAHAKVLAAAGLLKGSDLPQLEEACDALVREVAEGTLAPSPADEDVHSLVERELTERLGEIGARIHAGRSRNDLVVTDLRLWCGAQARELSASVRELIGTLCDLAESHLETVMPGFTHLQRAQPVSLAHHLCAHGFAFLRDVGRLGSAAEAADVSALGAGALAGTTLPLDPRIAQEDLGFARLFENSMDAVSDRDFACDLAYAAALLGIHLSRLGEEVVLWTSQEFGFARLADEWSTGSSMMPQKRNPDLAELIRGRAAGAVGDLVSLITLSKGLPLAYDRDLQEDKEPLFRAVDRAAMGTAAARHLLTALTFDEERLAEAAAGGGAFATDLAERLVDRGVPFREAHEAAGRLVARIEGSEVTLADAPDGLLGSVHARLDDRDREVADPRRSLHARRSPGGPAPDRVREQIQVLRAAAGPS